ncbi:VOC family protein [Arthrobacter sp. ISL-65]|uniref:VOC family protein n=1 Tax=Arthrobacter sp. ISL-65 TaxID=2819112 RepID=UPI0020358A40|nr:VOC family protein [Arthrobacter sp. ISL-65]
MTEYVAPSWPEGPHHQQLHLDIAVDELESATDVALALGATPAKHQPAPEQWRVLLDPVGHPFCFAAVRPD